MTKLEFLRSLDFEAAKNTIARKLHMKPDNLKVKVLKNGVFEIDLKGANDPVGAIVYEAKRAVLCVTRVDIGETIDKETGKPTGAFAYNADISISIKNGDVEYNAIVGELDFIKNKLIFSTNAEIVAQEKAAKEKQKAKREVAKKKAAPKKTPAKKKTTPKKVSAKKVTTKKTPVKKEVEVETTE